MYYLPLYSEQSACKSPVRNNQLATSPCDQPATSPHSVCDQPAISLQERFPFGRVTCLTHPGQRTPGAKYEHIFSFSKWMFSQTLYVCAIAHVSSRVAISHSPKSHTVSPSTTSFKPAFSTMSTSPRGARQDALLRLQGLNQSGDGLVP